MNVALEWTVNLGMNEYISKEYIRNMELKRWSDACGAESYAYSRVLEDIAEAPIADVVEVKHGHWELIPNHDALGFCSVCKFKPAFVSYKYCPNCGTKMDQEDRT